MTSPSSRTRPAGRFRRFADRVDGVRARARATPGGRIAWRILATVTGVLIVVVGIILLPLPGPGWLIIFAGLGVLATEYPWAARLLGWLKQLVGRWTRWAAERGLATRIVLGVLALALLVAIVWASWYAYKLR